MKAMQENDHPAGRTLWCNAGFSGEALQQLQTAAATHHYHLILADDSHTDLATATIAFGQPDPEIVRTSARLQWIQLTSAGYTRYDRDDLRAALPARGATLTNSSRVFDEPCAQHAFAMLLALARELLPAYENQRTERGWPTSPLRPHSYLLNGQTVVLLGFGAIGQRLAQLLAPLEMQVIAVRRTVQSYPGVEVVAEADTDRVLPLADHVISSLPESPSTRGFVDAARLPVFKPGARFYNIGRGATVDQEALLAALHSGHLSAAYLDVTDPEPLPSDHPLWITPNCYITPHTAGGHAGEEVRLVQHFVNNLSAFESGAALTDRVI